MLHFGACWVGETSFTLSFHVSLSNFTLKLCSSTLSLVYSIYRIFTLKNRFWPPKLNKPVPLSFLLASRQYFQHFWHNLSPFATFTFDFDSKILKKHLYKLDDLSVLALQISTRKSKNSSRKPRIQIQHAIYYISTQFECILNVSDPFLPLIHDYHYFTSGLEIWTGVVP